MTQTKVTKTIAIILAMVLAFAFMGVGMLQNAKAAGTSTTFTGTGYSVEIIDPVVTGSNYSYEVSRASFGKDEAPVFKFSIKFSNKDGTMTDKALESVMKFFQDEEFKREFALTPNMFTVEKKTAEEVTFAIDFKDFSGLILNGDNYLVLDKELTSNGTNEGNDVVFKFTLPGTKSANVEPANNNGSSDNSNNSNNSNNTPRSTTKSSYSYSYRTVTASRTTYRTITTTNKRVTPANTDDPSHMPLWVSLAILAAGAGAMTYVWKQRDE